MKSRKAAAKFGWTLALCGSFALRTLAQPIVINEIHYNPDAKTDKAEFVELYNAGTNTVNLQGWYFSDGLNYAPGSNYTFSATNLAPGGYVVVAQSPSFLQTKYGAVGAMGPFTQDGSSQLSRWGEKLTLRNAAGDKMDEVTYQMGFPWPTVGDSNAPGVIVRTGCSIELMNPGLDNDMGGSWRSSLNFSGPTMAVITNGSLWQYRKGTSEASSPTTAWRAQTYDDSAWESGVGPFAYELGLPIGTLMSDMKSNYSSIFLRKTFVLTDLTAMTNVLLDVMYNGGFKLWINESNLLNVAMPATEAAYNASSPGPEHETASYETFVINARSSLHLGTNILALQVHNLGATNEDFFFDARLRAQVGPAVQGPTPGRRNSVYATNAPPQIRQVQHTPEQPKGGDTVQITAKVTDPEGVASVVLDYQVVEPGSYIEITDAEYTNNWVTVAMKDDGSGGDVVVGDDIYSVTLPASVQTHRRLIRYRITVTDNLGFSVRVPYADDPQPNFAYFVYNGVPAWQGAVQPGAAAPMGTVFTVSSNAMGRLPVYYLIAKSNTVSTTVWPYPSWYMDSIYRGTGTLVYDGKVYDNIHYRMRGGVWRYSMVKNMWKFDLNRGHDLEARDSWGKKYKVPWSKLNFGANIQQGDYNHRGEQGMFESVAARLFELAGVDSFRTAFVTFRVIDDAAEAKADQFDGDWWGMYLQVENEDGRFLDNHGLPDGNYYKMDGDAGSYKNMAPNGPSDASDVNNSTTGIVSLTTASQTEAWFRQHWNVPQFYSYQAIVCGIHHYDINFGKNFNYFHNPTNDVWSVMPWDYDLTWAHNMYENTANGGGKNRLGSALLKYSNAAGIGSQAGTYNVVLTGATDRQNFEREFKNRVREIRDLLFNSDQAWKLIDEHAWLVRGPTTAPSIIDADRCQWDYNPKMTSTMYAKDNLNKAQTGRYYQFPGESATNGNLRGSFDATIQIMKNYVGIRGEHLDSLAYDAAIPNQPVITYTGPSNYPISRITFNCSSYSNPSNTAFASVRWRLAEVSDYNTANYDPGQSWKYEIETVWDSGPISPFTTSMTIPASAMRVGSRYRVRAMFTDVTGRNSSWSAPHEFTCGLQDNLADLMNYLRITEIMFNPPAGGYEYIELHNFSPTVALDLTGVKFTDGIDFAFTNGTIMPPGGYLLLIGTPYVSFFRTFYGLDASVPIVAYYTASLNNAGERLELKTSAGGSNILAFSYGDGRGWPLAADGSGHSLVLLDTVESAQGNGAGEYAFNWRSSTYLKGSPGRGDTVAPVTLLINEVAANTQSTNNPLTSDDWIELYNPTDTAFTIGTNWFLSDDGADLKKWIIPSNTVVPAKGFVTFDEETGFHNPTNIGFGISASGEQIFLSYLPGNNEDRVVDSVTFKAQEAGWTWGRYPDGGAYWWQLAPTPGDTNVTPGLHLVITEFMYHPPDIGGTNDNSRDEFVEIYNPTESAVPLYNSNGTWRLNGGISLDFPTNLVLNAGEYLLAVNFDPSTNMTQLAEFKTLYRISDPNLKIVGPFGGKLNNSSDRVALEKPQFDVPGNPAWVLIDEVLYLDQSPWPCGSDGTDASLHRLSVLEHGNNPANWVAQEPTPGAVRTPVPAGAPTIVTQPISQRVPANATVMFLVSICGPQPYVFQWFYNGLPLANATNSVLNLSDVGMIDAGQYQVVVSNSVGATYSTIAVLEVYYAPIEILKQPQPVNAKGSKLPGTYGQVISNVNFSVMVTGTKPIKYQWYRDGFEVPGGTNALLTLTNANVDDEGFYSVTMSNILGVQTSDSALLQIAIDPIVRQDPDNWTVVTGATVNFTVVATGHPMPLTYRWRKDGFFLANGLFTLNSSNCTLTLSGLTTNYGGSYNVLVTNSPDTRAPTSGNGYLTVVVPPTNQYVRAGSNVSLKVEAFCGKSWTSKLRYKWQLNGTDLAYRTNTTLTITNFQAAQEGIYSVVVINPTNYAKAFTAEVFLDSDGDGIPDYWESAHSMNPSVAGDAAEDADHDGMSNLQEFLAGTDPQDGNDVLRLGIANTDALQLQFTARSNIAYRIEYTDVLSTNLWNQLIEIAPAPTNRLVEQAAPAEGTNRFYRVMIPYLR